jgi:cytochrome c55X
LAPALLPQNLAATPDEALIEAILDGRPGTPMPPWGFEISPDEAAWMVRQLKGGLAE